jgi:hypothetical protein
MHFYAATQQGFGKSCSRWYYSVSVSKLGMFPAPMHAANRDKVLIGVQGFARSVCMGVINRAYEPFDISQYGKIHISKSSNKLI